MRRRFLRPAGKSMCDGRTARAPSCINTPAYGLNEPRLAALCHKEVSCRSTAEPPEQPCS